MVRRIIKYILTIALLTLILWKVGKGKFAREFSELNSPYLLPALLSGLLITLLRVYKWLLLARSESPLLTLTEACRSFLFGLGVRILTPSVIGEFSRILHIQQGDKLKLTSLVAADKIVDLAIIGVVSGICICLLGFAAGLIITAFSAVVIIHLYLSRQQQSLLLRFFRLLPFKNKLQRLIDGIQLLSGRLITLCLIISLLTLALNIFQFHFLLQAFSRTRLSAAVISLPIIILTNILPFTIGNLGIREGTAALVLHQFGTPEAAAISAIFITFIINVVLPGIIGIVISIHTPAGKASRKVFLAKKTS